MALSKKSSSSLFSSDSDGDDDASYASSSARSTSAPRKKTTTAACATSKTAKTTPSPPAGPTTTIFIKSGPRAFCVDAQLDGDVDALKVKLRAQCTPGELPAGFQVLFKGKALVAGTPLRAAGVAKEATLHLAGPPPFRVTVAFGGEREITAPNNGACTVAQLTAAVRTAMDDLASDMPSPLGLQRRTRKPAADTDNDNNDDDACFSAELAPHLTLAAAGVQRGSVLRPCKHTAPRTADDVARDADASKKNALLESFAGSAASADGVDIVFAFDTTGSMAAILANVRTQVAETCRRLFGDIKQLRIGIMCVGDFCDSAGTGYATRSIALTNDVDAICKFVRNCPSTGGGDAPEAYELALREVQMLGWRDDAAKALVMIGDCEPHPPSYTDEAISWWEELAKLCAMNVKVYGVHASHSTTMPSRAFYNEIAERSGGIAISFASFHLITDMFLAICYREADSAAGDAPSGAGEKLATFEAETKARRAASVAANDNANDAGARARVEADAKASDAIFEQLKKENAEKDATFTVDNFDVRTSPHYQRQPWFDFALDNPNANPYSYNGKLGKWLRTNTSTTSVRSPSSSTPTSSIRSSSSSTACKPKAAASTSWWSSFFSG